MTDKLNIGSPIVNRKTFGEDDLDHLYERYGFAVSPLLANVHHFMSAGGQLNGVHFGDIPTAPHRQRRRYWLAGIKDGEVGEFLDADFSNDLVEYIDGAIDVSYIAMGGLIEACEGRFKVADILFKEVCRSNDTKLIGCEVRSDGKVKKGPNFEEPRILAILEYFDVKVPEKIGMVKTENGDRIATLPGEGE